MNPVHVRSYKGFPNSVSPYTTKIKKEDLPYKDIIIILSAFEACIPEPAHVHKIVMINYVAHDDILREITHIHDQ